VGSGPVYITGSLYEYKGGPLVARTPTLIDTNAQDAWEKPGVGNAVFPAGVSGVFAVNQQPVPAGHRTMVDDVSSVSDGPAAVNPTPADGAAGVGSHPILMWTEASFATGRRLWFGPAGAMSEVLPAPAATIYNPGPLAFGTTYQWQVDQFGPGGAVPGHIWTFTTSLCDAVDDFESYADDTAIEVAWPHNIPPHPTKGPYHYIFLETGQVAEGSKSMRFEYQNQYTPYLTMATRTFATPQNWAATLAKSLVLDFRGRQDNVDQTLFVQVADTTGHQATATHPFIYAVQSEHWEQWRISLAEFALGGVDLSAVRSLTVGLGNGTNSGQADGDRDTIYIDAIRLCPAQCVNGGDVDLRADLNGDCIVDFHDLAMTAAGWLNAGTVTP